MNMGDTNVLEESKTRVEAYKKAYLEARARVLKDMPLWRRREILELESKKDLDNRYYVEFVRDVIALAEDS